MVIQDIKYQIYTFRTLPLDRHEDERKPTLLGGDDPDDHLFLILSWIMILMTIYLWTWSWVWSLNPWRSSPSRGSIKTPDLSDGSWKAPSVNRPLMESLRPAQNYEDGQTRWSSRYKMIQIQWDIRHQEKFGSSRNIYSELSVHTVQTRLV